VLRRLPGKAPKRWNIEIFLRFGNAARQNASARKNVKLFLREPLTGRISAASRFVPAAAQIAWVSLVRQSLAASKTIANFALQATAFAIKIMSLRHYSGDPPYRLQSIFTIFFMQLWGLQVDKEPLI
jgi:hypothetical protein